MIPNNYLSKTNRGWKTLYARLETEQLLPSVHSTTRPTPAWVVRYGWAAALVGLCLATGWLLQQPNQPPGLVLSNQAGQPVLATLLNDGSAAYLGQGATLEYGHTFGASERTVRLAGNAFFDVEKDNKHPFLIQTQAATVTVVGTSFLVQAVGRDSFALLVRHGTVHLAIAQTGQTMLLQAGETGQLQGGQLHKGIANEAVFDAYLRQIHFKDEPLGHVVRLLNNRWPNLPITVAPALENRRLTLSLSGNDPQTVAQLIALALDARLTQTGNTLHLIE